MTEHLPRDFDEFVCADCGISVYSVPPRNPPPTVCATCAHLNEFVADPVERELLRRRLMGPAMTEAQLAAIARHPPAGAALQAAYRGIR